jgi:dihydrofolate synthase/folylpolyglutamate synthase
MQPRSLDAWLSYIERQHPAGMHLGLERMAQVLSRLDLVRPAPVVITVAGTNGKGSTIAFLEAIYREAGYRTGAYTSPHLNRYNERVRIAGAEVDDEALCQAFEAVERARGDCELTYFEFATAAAFVLFRAAAIDVALLEVGLGGRLDAVNAVDADAAVVVSIGLDHVEWLGPTREDIGWEKAHVYRGARPAICADTDPPARLLDHARHVGAELKLIGRDFRIVPIDAAHWRWEGWDGALENLPVPRLVGTLSAAERGGWRSRWCVRSAIGWRCRRRRCNGRSARWCCRDACRSFPAR